MSAAPSRLPVPARQIRFACPGCRKAHTVDARYQGRKGRCPACGTVVRMGARPPAQASTRPAPRPAPSPALAGAAVAAPAGASDSSALELDLLPAPERRVPTPEPDGRRRSEPAGDGSRHGGGRRRRYVSPSRAGRILIRHERHLRAIAFWHLLAAALGALGCGLGLIGAVIVGSESLGLGAATLLVLLPALLVVAVSGALGWGLWRYHGWARWLHAGGVALGLLALLVNVGQVLPHVGSAPGAVVLVGVLVVGLELAWLAAYAWALLCPAAQAICSPDYREAVAKTPLTSVDWYASPFFLIPVLLMFLGVLGGLLLSFGPLLFGG